MALIDKDQLKAEIERRKKENDGIRCKANGAYCVGYDDAFYDLLAFLDTLPEQTEYLRKDIVVDAIKLTFGKVSMNPFDCSEAFEELLNKVGYEIH